MNRRYHDRCRVVPVASHAVGLCEGGTSIAIGQPRRHRSTGGIGGLGGNGSGGGMGLGGVGLGGVGVGVGAGLGFCGTFIASKYLTLTFQLPTPDAKLDIDPGPWPKVEAASLPLAFDLKRLEAAKPLLPIAAICRRPGKLGCSRRQIPRPFDN